MPSPNTTIQRRELNELAQEYALEKSRTMFSGLEIMPIYETMLQSGNYPSIPIEEMLKPRDTRRSAKGAYNRGDWAFEQPNFSTKENGWEEVVDDAEARNYASYFDAEAQSTRICMDVLLRAQEVRIAAVQAAQTAHAVSVKWSTAATATPQKDIETGQKTIMNATGMLPDTLQITWQTFKNCLRTDRVTDALKYTSPVEGKGFEAQKAALATFFGVPRIVVTNAIKNGSKEGATFSASNIWNDAYGLLCITGSGDLSEPIWGRTMLWTGDSPDNVVVESYREENVRGEIIRCRQNTQELVVNASAGYLLTNLA
jgi:hypothetical protein